jgi:ribonuclease BN (tRNA processing enzyme)
VTVRLDCLGSGWAFSTGSYWNGWLLDGRILLDCPPQALVHLYRLGRTPADLDLMLLSHEHSDHVGGIDTLMLDLHLRHRDALDHSIGIAAPAGVHDRIARIVDGHAHFLGRDDDAVQWFEVGDGDAFEHRDARVEVVAMRHSVPDNGYRVRLDGGVVAYTGDTSPGDHILRLADGADVLIVECGGPAPGVHSDWPDLLELRAELDDATQMLVTHYDATSVPEGFAADGIELAVDFGRYEYSSQR